jgi:hypothetical protein
MGSATRNRPHVVCTGGGRVKERASLTIDVVVAGPGPTGSFALTTWFGPGDASKRSADKAAGDQGGHRTAADHGPPAGKSFFRSSLFNIPDKAL